MAFALTYFDRGKFIIHGKLCCEHKVRKTLSCVFECLRFCGGDTLLAATSVAVKYTTNNPSHSQGIFPHTHTLCGEWFPFSSIHKHKRNNLYLSLSLFLAHMSDISTKTDFPSFFDASGYLLYSSRNFSLTCNEKKRQNRIKICFTIYLI